MWQFGLRDVDWEAVERLQQEIRDYRAAGVIGPFEVRIRTNEARLDAMVTAEIVDAVKLADLRGLEHPAPLHGCGSSPAPGGRPEDQMGTNGECRRKRAGE